jgi:hypothetical protein
MANDKSSDINKPYILGVSAITFLLPIICCYAEIFFYRKQQLSFELIGKWFLFYAVGVRLFLAGIRQITNPAFTAKEIFHLQNPGSFPIVRELGFANLCFGLIGLISLFLPAWRMVSAFGSGLYYGLAAAQHFIKKPAGTNEKFALVTDVIIFAVLLIYFIKMIPA